MLFMVVERWVPVPGYEGSYEVSSAGNVRSLDRLTCWSNGRRVRRRGKVLRQALTGGRSPRWCVVLYKDGGEQKTWLVGTLVNLGFHGPRPPGLVTRHGPAGSLENREENVCWGTLAENAEDTLRDGTRARGERNGAAKLTGAAVIECRRRYAAGERLGTLAAEFSVDAATMCNAVSGARWAHLPGAVEPTRRHGQQGEAHHAAKLTCETVAEARRRYAAGEPEQALADELGVTQQSMYRALRGVSWTDAGGPLAGSNRRLTAEIVRDCRRRYAAGETQAALAAEFGVAYPTMNQALVGRTWADA